MTIKPPDLHHAGQARAVWGRQLRRRVHEFAIFDDAGCEVPHCGVRMTQITTVAPKAPRLDRPMDTVSGPTLFAGLATPQFGHMLTNALGRLWALDDLPPDTTLYFITRWAPTPEVRRLLVALLRAFGVRNPVIVSKDNLSFDDLYLASYQFGEIYDGRGSDRFYAWIDACLTPLPPIEHDLKLYVTRSGLGKSAGRFVLENLLEQYLVAEGYQVIAPETLDLGAQIDLYRRAGSLVFAEGSALHLYGLMARPEQRAALIKRRMALPKLMINQINDRAGVHIAILDAIREIHWPPRIGDHFSISTLDFPQLQRQLRDHALVSGQKAWGQPNQAVVKADLCAGLQPGEVILDAAARQEFINDRRAGRAARA